MNEGIKKSDMCRLIGQDLTEKLINNRPTNEPHELMISKGCICIWGKKLWQYLGDSINPLLSYLNSIALKL